MKLAIIKIPLATTAKDSEAMVIITKKPSMSFSLNEACNNQVHCKGRIHITAYGSSIPARGAISTHLCELVRERLLRTSKDFVLPVDYTFHGRFIIDVEFLNLQVYSENVSNLTS
ncbi:hypothetical protein Tco_0685668 [Tanacetum coccineum]